MMTAKISVVALWWKIAVMLLHMTSLLSALSRDISLSLGAADSRIITNEALFRDSAVRQFTSEGITNYSRILIDQQNNVVYIGARDYLLRLELHTLKQLDRVSWPAQELSVSICLDKGQTRDNCRNYIRVIEVHGDRLLVCGTHAFSPKCSWRETRQPNNILDWVTGVSRCPYHPLHNSSSLMTSSGSLFSATVTDFSGRDAALYRSLGSSKMLRTVEHDSRWLNNPDFVSLYEIHDFVYLFFREVATEFINCGKNVFSRVARVCKNDLGGKYALGDNWSSFVKARLNCSLPGDYPFYFSEVQSTHWDPDMELLYAVFTTAPTSVYASAICVYNIPSFEKAFSGPYKFQENSHMAWTRAPNNIANHECPSSDGTKLREHNSTHSRLVIDPQKYMLMDLAVQPKTVKPLVVSEGERYSHIVVDTVFGKDRQPFTVLFLATLEGVIKKVVLLPEVGSCTVEMVEVIPLGSGGQIKSLQLVKKLGMLVVATESKLVQIPLERCNRFSSETQCVGARDPYCAWNSLTRQCISLSTLQNSDIFAATLLQDVSSCPVLQLPVDGQWTDWTQWSSCPRNENGDTCQCRHRSCTSPQPEYGGTTCIGHDVEVINCTLHGGWSEWSGWSACSVTCGTHARKTRRRLCNNPRPAFGGNICLGVDVEEDFCKDNPSCADDPLKQWPLLASSPVSATWTEWSSWSECTDACGGGIQSRARACSSGSATNHNCLGNDREWQSCNLFPCPEIRRVSEWTPWIVANQTSEGGHVEERYRIICKARVADDSALRSHIKTEARFCAEGLDHCAYPVLVVAPTNDVNGGWSPWSQWTDCDTLCDGGLQTRERHCNNPSPSGRGQPCMGHSRETRTCNTHSCQGQWSCWGEFSSCSATCGSGIKTRKRHCMPSNLDDTDAVFSPCPGLDTEKQPCIVQECDDGWYEWTQWSLCGRNRIQYRSRTCAYGQCLGSNQETRACRPSLFAGKNADDVAVASVSGEDAEAYQLYHLILVGAVGFVSGIIVMCIGLCVYCQCRKLCKKQKTSSQPEESDSLSSSLRRRERRKTNAPSDYVRSFSTPEYSTCHRCSMDGGMNRLVNPVVPGVVGGGGGNSWSLTVSEASQKQAMYGRYSTWSRYPHLSTGCDDLDEEDSGRFTMSNGIPPMRTHHQRAMLNTYS